MQQHGSKYFARRPTPFEGQNLTFSEHGHVANQIKGNYKCSNVVAIILPADPPLDPGCGFKRSKFNFFRT